VQIALESITLAREGAWIFNSLVFFLSYRDGQYNV